MIKKTTLGFIGAGRIVQAFLQGFIKAGYEPNDIWVSCPTDEHLQILKKEFSVCVDIDNAAIASKADILILAVKPKVMTSVLAQLQPVVAVKKPLVISLVAGISLNDIVKILGNEVTVLRGMPNICAAVQCGLTAFYTGETVTSSCKELVERIFNLIGAVVWLESEKCLSTITALTGSGPAYFFLFLQALEQAGIALGLPKEMAHRLTLQTALGSIQMAIESEQDLAELCQQVAPQGGGTERALQVLQSAQFSTLILNAVKAAKERYDNILS